MGIFGVGAELEDGVEDALVVLYADVLTVAHGGNFMSVDLSKLDYGITSYMKPATLQP